MILSIGLTIWLNYLVTKPDRILNIFHMQKQRFAVGLHLQIVKAILNKLTEQDLVRKCRKGHRGAQRLLYERYADRMFRLCHRYLKNPEDANDTMMTGFVNVFKNIDRFEQRGEGALEAWTSRIMVNACLTHIRRTKKMEVVTEYPELLAQEGAASDGIEAEDIHNMVLDLPIGYRTVFNLYAIEGFSHKEIAQELGIGEATSRSQLSKARDLLKKRLDQQQWKEKTSTGS